MSKTTPILVGVAVVTSIAIGCAAPNQVVYSSVNQPPRPFQRRTTESVEVFIAKPPSRPHLDVGVFEVYQGRTDDGSGLSTEDMIRTLRFHGALRGCDAVQIMNIEVAGGRYPFRVVRGVCEIYTDDQAPHAAAGAPVPPLPGEGNPCSVEPESALACSDPLVCENRRCVSPYH